MFLPVEVKWFCLDNHFVSLLSLRRKGVLYNNNLVTEKLYCNIFQVSFHYKMMISAENLFFLLLFFYIICSIYSRFYKITQCANCNCSKFDLINNTSFHIMILFTLILNLWKQWNMSCKWLCHCHVICLCLVIGLIN